MNSRFAHIDWILLFATLPLVGAGLVTMRELGNNVDYFFTRQIIWAIASFGVFFVFSFIDWRFLKKGEFLLFLFGASSALLLILLAVGKTVRGVSSWIDLGFLSIEPADPIKILLILMLAKYFSRRHVEIAHVKHIIVSGFYAVVPFMLVFLQPDLGSAFVIFMIWLGMIIIAGASKKHLALLVLASLLIAVTSWLFVLKPYQKNRLTTFINPLSDIRGAGYNALQSTIAVGSGEIFGKGIGYGSQSRLQFLPEHQTDFIFAAFAEEWGFVGVIFIFTFFGIIVWRISWNAYLAPGNFESLFGLGLVILITTHFIINVGMNIGLLPITGLNLPFISYGGTNMLTIFASLGMLMGMRRFGAQAIRGDTTMEVN